MAQARDMSQKEFNAACERRGFRRVYFGYYSLGHIPGYGELEVYAALDSENGTKRYPVFHGVEHARNAGDRRRDQLAYLIAERKRYEEKASGLTP